MNVGKKAVLGAAAIVTALVTHPTAAGADQGDALYGGCGLLTAEQQLITNGQQFGNFIGLVITTHANGTPSGATITCWVDVNGVEAPGTRMTFRSGGPSPSRTVSYSEVDGDTVTVCMQATFDDGSKWVARDGNVGTDCPATTQTNHFGVTVVNGVVFDDRGPISAVDAGTVGRAV